MSLLIKGVTTFLELTDTPDTFSGQAEKVVRVNTGETALELLDDKKGFAFIIDGSGAAIAAGQKGHLVAPFDCEIIYVELEADQSGSIKVDIWKDTYANFPPDDADSICGGNEPEISTAQKYRDTTLTSWTKSVSQGDVFAFYVDSCTTITRCTVTLGMKRI